jgi:hypothetical protein
VWSGSYEQQPVPGELTRFYPIATINVPILLTSPVILVNCTSVNAPLNWKFAGYLRQVIPSPLLIGAATTANTRQERIYLNRLSLIQFERLVSTYQLLIDIPYWIIDVQLSIFEYVGIVADTIQRLETIEAKIDNLN